MVVRKKMYWLLIAVSGALMACALPAVASAQTLQGPPAWQKMVAAGRQEGKVVVLGPPIRRFGSALDVAFRKATGIKVEYLGLPGGAQNLRIRQEMASGKPNLDVLIGGGAELITLLPKGEMAPIAGHLVLPQVTNPKYWRGGKLKWADDKHNKYMLETTQYAMTDLFINADKVNTKNITSWKDLLKPRFKGKIVAMNPTSRGPAQATAAYLLYKFGEKFIVHLFKGGNVTIVRNERQMADMMVRGSHPIGIGLATFTADIYRKQGFKLRPLVLMDAPGSLVGGYGVLKILKGAPDLQAAYAFVNWYATRTGQNLAMKYIGEPSLRTDVNRSLIPAYMWPRPGIHYGVDQYTEEFYTKIRPKLKKRLVQLLGR